MFSFNGRIPASKSWMNRALVIQHFNPTLIIDGQADSEDVNVLKESIGQITKQNNFYLGQGGTSLRFFSFLISRHIGSWQLSAHPRLLQRPQSELADILKQLSVEVETSASGVEINSKGWKIPKLLYCKADSSSQFISGLLLSAWNLETELNIEIEGPIVSKDYLTLTIDLLQKCGMSIQYIENVDKALICVKAGQQVNIGQIQAELDVSSAFSLVAAAVINGQISITNWNSQSKQPDLQFLNIFNQMGIEYQINDSIFKIKKQNNFNSVEANLNSCPDLFPVLSCLCAFAKGKSVLFGASQLKYKESDRLQKTKELLDLCGFNTELKSDGMIIHGQSATPSDQKIVFNPDQDHRMAMAAGILKLSGFNIHIQTPEVVQKSYPNFWTDIAVSADMMVQP